MAFLPRTFRMASKVNMAKALRSRDGVVPPDAISLDIPLVE
jgi:hypothetical protein